MQGTIGQLLLSQGKLHPDQLARALSVQKQRGGRLGEILIGIGAISEEEFLQLLADQHQVMFFTLSELLGLEIAPGCLEMVPYDLSLKHGILPIQYNRTQGMLEVVTNDPQGRSLSESVASRLQARGDLRQLRYAIATSESLNRAIRYHYGKYKRQFSSATSEREESAQPLQPELSQEMVLLATERLCPNCGYPYEPGDILCMRCSAPLREASTDPLSGRILRQKWQLNDKLGEGGMGVVYRGVNLDYGREVAIKILRSQLNTDPDSRKRFFREARTQGALSHPNIVQVIEFGFEERTGFFLIMELVKGENLKEFVGRYAEVAPTERLYQVFSQVCDGMAFAHAQGIVHRDLKPENIFLHQLTQEQTQVKVMDFGIAKFLDVEESRLTRTGMALGTPHFLSPEQATGSPVGYYSDIYSLGVILFETLTLRPLFEASSPYQYLMRHVYTQPSLLGEVRPDLGYSRTLEELVTQCLAKNPHDRPSSMIEVKERLQKGLLGEDTIQMEALVLSETLPAPSVKEREAPTLPQEAPSSLPQEREGSFSPPPSSSPPEKPSASPPPETPTRDMSRSLDPPEAWEETGSPPATPSRTPLPPSHTSLPASRTPPPDSDRPRPAPHRSSRAVAPSSLSSSPASLLPSASEPSPATRSGPLLPSTLEPRGATAERARVGASTSYRKARALREEYEARYRRRRFLIRLLSFLVFLLLGCTLYYVAGSLFFRVSAQEKEAALTAWKRIERFRFPRQSGANPFSSLRRPKGRKRRKRRRRGKRRGRRRKSKDKRRR